MLYWYLKDMFASSVCRSPVKDIADTLFHLGNDDNGCFLSFYEFAKHSWKYLKFIMKLGDELVPSPGR